MPEPICSAPRPSEGRGAEDRRDDGQDVDDPAAGAVGVLLTDERGEHRAYGLPAAPAEGAVGDAETDHRVDRPRVERPVEQGGGHGRGHAVAGVGRVGAGRGRGVVRQRLAHAVEHQADAHARAEHHGDPGHGLELGFLALGAEVDAAVAAGGKPEGEDHEPGRGQRERPAAVVQQATEHAAGDVLQRVGGGGAPDDERQGEDGRDAEDDSVGPGPVLLPRQARFRTRKRASFVLFLVAWSVLRHRRHLSRRSGRKYSSATPLPRKTRNSPPQQRVSGSPAVTWYVARSSRSSGTRARCDWRSGT
ncbi:hypothetical protein RKD37_001635 [Streptomyces ambofaciens]